MRTLEIRASIGTLAELGLVENLKAMEKPRTAYLLQYSETGCNAGCRFCLQSKTNHAKYTGIRLGRVTWPVIELNKLLAKWRKVFSRICLQTVIKPYFAQESLEIIEAIREIDRDTPLSLAITPVSTDILRKARTLGVDILGVGLDTATEKLFNEWRKPHSWNTYLRFIDRAVEIHGSGNVYVHLIAGLGESLRESVSLIKRIYEKRARVALFNNVDQRGYSSIRVEDYRLIQIARLLVENGYDPDEYIDYESRRLVKKPPLDLLEAFYTSGCPDCNRPFYNENPSGPIYNIPSRRMLSKYMDKLREELALIGVVI